MKHYTTIEQSKKLLELGLNPDSADMYYFLDPTPAGNIYHLTVQRVDVGVKNLPEYSEDDIPCWSLGALRKLLPVGIKNEKGDTYLFSDHKRLDGTWVYQYAIEDDTFVYFSGIDIDACFRMIIWLLENNYIKKGE